MHSKSAKIKIKIHIGKKHIQKMNDFVMKMI